VPLSLPKSVSFYTTSASKPTANLIEGTVPFFRFSGPSLRAVMRGAFADAFSAISAAHDGPAIAVAFPLFHRSFTRAIPAFPRKFQPSNPYARFDTLAHLNLNKRPTLELWRLRVGETSPKAKVTPQAQSTSIKARVAIRHQRFVSRLFCLHRALLLQDSFYPTLPNR
jgi:hypothetical protein